MGMAASQARLLTLTSRLHDIEYKAQNIESQKIALATQKDEAWQAYNDALDAKKIQVAFYNGNGTKTFVDANFSTVCGYDSSRCTQYALTDAKTGKLIVSSEIAEMYETYDSDKYCFAWAMVGYAGCFCWDSNNEDEQFIGRDNQDNNDFVIMTEAEEMVFNKHQDDSDLVAAYDDINNAETLADKREALQIFRDMLYEDYSKELFSYMNLDKQDSKDAVLADPENNQIYGDVTWTSIKDEFNYYVALFEKIQDCGGCQEIEEQYVAGEEGKDWFNNMVKTGRVLISEFNKNTKEWDETSVATSTSTSFLQEVEDDTGLKKAEAEYEHELDIINTKDTKFDQELSKLETERTSITTEIESIGKVRDDNIERTFGIFS